MGRFGTRMIISLRLQGCDTRPAEDAVSRTIWCFLESGHVRCLPSESGVCNNGRRTVSFVVGSSIPSVFDLFARGCRWQVENCLKSATSFPMFDAVMKSVSRWWIFRRRGRCQSRTITFGCLVRTSDYRKFGVEGLISVWITSRLQCRVFFCKMAFYGRQQMTVGKK